MTGQIPPYGRFFRLERAERWDPFLTHSLYVLRVDGDWLIRSDKTRKRWRVYYRGVPVGNIVFPSLTSAMGALTGVAAVLYEGHDGRLPACQHADTRAGTTTAGGLR